VDAAKVRHTPAIRSPPSSQASSPTSICVVTTYTIIVLGILSILPIRPVRPDSSARTRCWRAEATQRAASRPRHYRHRDLIVSIVVGTYIYISTYHHRHRAERAAPLVSEQSRSPSNPRDQILSQPSTQPPSSPARQDASIVQPVRPDPLHHQRVSFADRHPHPPRRHRRHRHPVIGHLYDISIYDISRSSACSCSPTPRASKRITASAPSSSPASSSAPPPPSCTASASTTSCR
jgi:hypothetical protein